MNDEIDLAPQDCTGTTKIDSATITIERGEPRVSVLLHFQPIPIEQEIIDIFAADGGSVQAKADEGNHHFVGTVVHHRGNTQIGIFASEADFAGWLQRQAEEHKRLSGS